MASAGVRTDTTSRNGAVLPASRRVRSIDMSGTRPEPPPMSCTGCGSGLVPLMSMLRTRRLAGSTAPFRLAVSVRSPVDAIYADELDALGEDVDITRVWTRQGPDGWTGRVGRVDAALLEAVCFPPEERAHVFVCGPTPFVESVADTLVDLGHDPERIRTERFGPTGP